MVVGAVADRSAELMVLGGAEPGGARGGGAARVAAIVLAAGAGRRFGGCKQLALVNGRPMVAQVTEAVLASGVDQVVVVLGSEAEAVAARHCQALRVTTVVNDDWQEGMGSSVRAGVAAVAPRADAVLFVLADQIRLTSAEIDAVVAAYRRERESGGSARIVAPVHDGRRGNPVLFDRRLLR